MGSARPDDAALAHADAQQISPDLVRGADGLLRPAWAATDPLLQQYYDTEWGAPVRDERGLFERLSLEAFQSGLSWVTILRKRPAFRQAFDDFDPVQVAAFTQTDVHRLLADAAIIRNRRKIEATIANAQATLALREQGGLPELIWSFQPAPSDPPTLLADIPAHTSESAALAKALRSKGFRFVGPTTMYALMKAIGMVDAHLMTSHCRTSASAQG